MILVLLTSISTRKKKLFVQKFAIKILIRLWSRVKLLNNNSLLLVEIEGNRPIRGGHEKPSFRLGGGGGRLQNAPSANAFL